MAKMHEANDIFVKNRNKLGIKFLRDRKSISFLI